MAYPDVPHLALPLRFVADTMAALEQDELDDVAQCVQVVVTTPLGFRDDEPQFGLADPAFTQGSVDPDALRTVIARWEPRADVEVDEAPDSLDSLVDHLTINLRGSTSG